MHFSEMLLKLIGSVANKLNFYHLEDPVLDNNLLSSMT